MLHDLAELLILTSSRIHSGLDIGTYFIGTGGVLVISTFPGPGISTYWASLSVQRSGQGPGLVISTVYNEVCTDKFCTNSESDKGGSRYLYCTNNETLV